LLEHTADGLAGLDQRSEIRAFVLVDRRGYGDDVDAGLGNTAELVGEAQCGGLCEQCWFHFQRAVVAAPQLGHAGAVDVVAGGGVMLAEFHCQWQADIAQADDGDAHVSRKKNVFH